MTSHPHESASPLRLRWNTLAGWYISGVSGLPRYEEQPGPVEYIRRDNLLGIRTSDGRIYAPEDVEFVYGADPVAPRERQNDGEA